MDENNSNFQSSQSNQNKEEKSIFDKAFDNFLDIFKPQTNVLPSSKVTLVEPKPIKKYNKLKLSLPPGRFKTPYFTSNFTIESKEFKVNPPFLGPIKEEEENKRKKYYLVRTKTKKKDPNKIEQKKYETKNETLYKFEPKKLEYRKYEPKAPRTQPKVIEVPTKKPEQEKYKPHNKVTTAIVEGTKNYPSSRNEEIKSVSIDVSTESVSTLKEKVINNNQKEVPNNNSKKLERQKKRSDLKAKIDIKDKDDELLIKEDSPYICDYEKNVIRFSKKGLLSFFDSLWNIEGYHNIMDDPLLTIDVKDNGSPLNSSYHLIRTKVIQPKKELNGYGNVNDIYDFIYEKKLRPMWDEILKELKILENKDSYFIANTHSNRPCFIMSERDSIEKRFKFIEGNTLCIFGTSIPDDLFPEIEDVVRITNFVNFTKISDEGDKIVHYILNQTNFKMIIPQFLVNVTLPSTTKSWYGNLSKFCQNIIYDRETKTAKKIEKSDSDEDSD